VRPEVVAAAERYVSRARLGGDTRTTLAVLSDLFSRDDAIAVLEGGRWRRRRPAARARWEDLPLTPSELRTLSAIAGGLNRQQAADAIGVGLETIKSQLKRAVRKLDCQTVAQATARAVALGLVS
jgi:DNA-binding CsgD family transcriptional regulator